jgi:hypothetical protein
LKQELKTNEINKFNPGRRPMILPTNTWLLLKYVERIR